MRRRGHAPPHPLADRCRPPRHDRTPVCVRRRTALPLARLPGRRAAPRGPADPGSSWSTTAISPSPPTIREDAGTSRGRWASATSCGSSTRARRRVEAVVSVDGLDAVDGKPASVGKRGYMIPAFGDVTIDGWRTSLSTVAAFRFSSVRDSYAARTRVTTAQRRRHRGRVLPRAAGARAPSRARADGARRQGRGGAVRAARERPRVRGALVGRGSRRERGPGGPTRAGDAVRRIAGVTRPRDDVRARRRRADGRLRAALRRPRRAPVARHPAVAAAARPARHRERAARHGPGVPRQPLRSAAAVKAPGEAPCVVAPCRQRCADRCAAAITRFRTGPRRPCRRRCTS